MDDVSPISTSPHGIRLVETSDGFEVSTTFRHWLFSTHAVLMAVGFTFAGFFTAALGFNTFRHVALEGWAKPILFSMLGLLLVYLGLRAAIGAFVQLFGTFVFRVSDDQAMCAVRFFGRKNGKWARTFRWSDVQEFSVTMADGNPPTPEFVLVLHDGTRIVFLDSVRGKKQAFLTEFFRRKVAEMSVQQCGLVKAQVS